VQTFKIVLLVVFGYSTGISGRQARKNTRAGASFFIKNPTPKNPQKNPKAPLFYKPQEPFFRIPALKYLSPQALKPSKKRSAACLFFPAVNPWFYALHSAVPALAPLPLLFFPFIFQCCRLCSLCVPAKTFKFNKLLLNKEKQYTKIIYKGNINYIRE